MALAGMLLVCAAAAPAADTITLTPTASSGVLLNPGKGFVISFVPSASIPPAALPYIGIGYSRFQWSDLEPVEGQIRWEVIDKRLDEWSALGKRFAFGVILASSHSSSIHVTPKWVFDAGAVGRSAPRPTAGGEQGNPGAPQVIAKSWIDPVLRAKYFQLIAAIAKRYDGDPRLVWFEIRNLGNWGEGHTAKSWRDPMPTLAQTVELLIKPHRQHFTKTPLMVCYQYVEEKGKINAVHYDALNALGIGFRDDGLMTWRDGSAVARCAGKAVSAFEWGGPYPDLKASTFWTSPDRNYEHCLRSGKVAYAGFARGPDTKAFLDGESPAFLAKMANLLGYHLVLTQATLPRAFTPGAPATVRLDWRNDGVAPPWFPVQVAIAALDANDQPTQTAWLTGADLCTIAGGATHSDARTFTVPTGFPATGRYAIGLFTQQGLAQPDIGLGITGRLANGWHVLGSNVVAARPLPAP